jgi:hypothetical protein
VIARVKFEETPAYQLGDLGQRLVMLFLQRRGHGVVPSYEFTGKGDESKAPKLMIQGGGLTLPDLDVCKDGRRYWNEVKTHARPAPNRRLGGLVHGIKDSHRLDYLRVESITGCAVYLSVLEVDSGHLLCGRLSSLEAHPCQCSACTGGLRCFATPRDNVYFLRDEFSMLHRFSDAEMAPLRRVHV